MSPVFVGRTHKRQCMRHPRGVYGTFHHLSKQHLHRYLSEFDFRYNKRDISDGERTEKAIQSVVGKRLMYRTRLA